MVYDLTLIILTYPSSQAAPILGGGGVMKLKVFSISISLIIDIISKCDMNQGLFIYLTNHLFSTTDNSVFLGSPILLPSE
jgi:hypothetical protein